MVINSTANTALPLNVYPYWTNVCFFLFGTTAQTCIVKAHIHIVQIHHRDK
jgi:hypothetical protein